MTYHYYEMQMKETMKQYLGETKVWNVIKFKEQKNEIIMRVALHVIKYYS